MEDDGLPDSPPRYNVPPASSIMAVRSNFEGGNEIVNLRWGLIPSWAKEEKIGWKMINARAETLQEKPSFQDALRKRRCVIPVDGFYEWKKTAEGKTPYFIRTADEKLFYLAGLWESWKSPGGETIESCTIVTTCAFGELLSLHDRMPVIISREQIALWLDATIQNVLEVEPLLLVFPADEMKATLVSTLVNSPKNDSVKCLEAA